MCLDGADMVAIWYNTRMASAYNLTVGISLAILLAILLGLLGVNQCSCLKDTWGRVVRIMMAEGTARLYRIGCKTSKSRLLIGKMKARAITQYEFLT